MNRIMVIVGLMAMSNLSLAQGEWNMKFEQLAPELRTPNTYRTASGAPGKDYWQQQVDYKIALELNDENQTITGHESITYYNQSPDPLTYLWVQLDQNIRQDGSTADLTNSDGLSQLSTMKDELNGKELMRLTREFDYEGGFRIAKVTSASGDTLAHTINETMMRIELSEPLVHGKKFEFEIDWSYAVHSRLKMHGRCGYEYFPADKNYLYAIAQFYPRLAVYDNVEGWQNKQFIGDGEFALEFGNYEVSLTVPADFVVAATGTLQNESQVLTEAQLSRLDKARKSFDAPVMIITPEEALANESLRSEQKKVWVFKADSVRDFAFAASRKFIWDAQAVGLNSNQPLAMSFYPKEGNPLWEQESTKAVVNALKTYSKYTFDYPYPVAISVHTAAIGMEYPMICFNFGRPGMNGQFTDATKWRMIGVIIHEVGHNFFPMIVNSDERQWTWMDEGLNSFLESMTQKENYPDMPRRRGPATSIIKYMQSEKEMMRPIMTNSEQILQFGNNAYGKPAAALNILRETIMGPELFDYAFKTYANRWAFKHPTPEDFFRTMEDASAVDLDWFWRGWFYTTDHVDISIDQVKWYKMGSPKPKTPEGKPKRRRGAKKTESTTASHQTDFNDDALIFAFKKTDGRHYYEFLERLDDEEIMRRNEKRNFYEVKFSNIGGLVMPVILEWTYEDGSKELETIPAEIWRHNENEFVKIFAKDKVAVSIVIDPFLKTADTNTENNYFPRSLYRSEFEQAKSNSKNEE